MSNKLKEIHDKLKYIANQQLVHDADLHECLKYLEDEINKITQGQSADDDDPPGGNNPSAPDIP